MATRKPTPDILGDLVGEPSAGHHTGTPVHQSTGVPENSPSRAPVHAPAERVKATFYLDPAVLERLDDAWHRLRKGAKGADRGKVSKSLIVEVALEVALQDLEDQGAASSLARKMGHQ